MFDVEELLLDICKNSRVSEPGIDLLESGLLDSLAFIELLSRLEDEGILIQISRIDRDCLRTVNGIKSIIYDEMKGESEGIQ